MLWKLAGRYKCAQPIGETFLCEYSLRYKFLGKIFFSVGTEGIETGFLLLRKSQIEK
jgi:hypothetical protein